ncbi:MAG: ubiquitin [Oscillospiraceae bacterium]|nr:ubiquitin [Oscillospiraceae bacterium]
MTDLEKAEKLREKAGVSYTEAKEALENAGGSLLDAFVYLEKQGRIDTPPGGGFYSGAGAQDGEGHSSGAKAKGSSSGETFSSMMKKFGAFCLKVLDKGLSNQLVASRSGEHLFSIPVIAFVVMLLFFFWVTIPLLIITLFCGVRYQFRGPDLEKESVNNAMNAACDMADDVKKTITQEVQATRDAYNAGKAGDEDSSSDAGGEAASDGEQGSAAENPAAPVTEAKDDDEVIYL